MDMLDLLKTLGGPVLTGAVGYFAGKGKRSAEVETIKQQNINLEFERINKALDQLEERNKALYEENRELNKELNELRSLVWKLMLENAELRARLGLPPSHEFEELQKKVSD